MPLAIDHINIVVSDLERSVRFYTELLGFKESKRAHLEGEWIESIVGLKGVVADVVFILAPLGEPPPSASIRTNRAEKLHCGSMSIPSTRIPLRILSALDT